MTIPDEAVDAALREYAAIEAYVPVMWEQPKEFRVRIRGRILRMLQAAEPHILAEAKAEAFDQGQKSGMRHADRLVAAVKIGRPELPGPLSPNPYRPTP